MSENGGKSTVIYCSVDKTKAEFVQFQQAQKSVSFYPSTQPELSKANLCSLQE